MTVWRIFLDRPRQWRPRRWFFQIHVWAGVLAALYVIVASITGSLLMLHGVLLPAGPRADVARGQQPVGPDAALDALRGAVPGFRAASLVLPNENGGAYGGFLLNRGQYAFAEVHPVTGEISRIVTRQNSGWRFIEDLHNNLLSGRTGRVVNGIGGLSVTLMCATGVIIWWPGRASWARALRVDWSARWPRRFWDLHSVTGIWLLPLTLLIAITGVYHTWPQWFRAPIAVLLPVSAPDRSLRFPEAEGQSPAPIENLLEKARAAVPHKRVHTLQLPADAMQPIRALMTGDGERIPAFADVVVLHPTTAQVVRIDRYADRPVGDRVIRWIGILHGGRFAGRLSEAIWFIAGLAMATLAVTGLAVWWNRIVRRRLWGPALEVTAGAPQSRRL